MNSETVRAPATRDVVLDDVTRLLAVVQFLDDILDALELWQSAGVTDGRWVGEVWARRAAPWARMSLPFDVSHATDGWSLHAALLRWQRQIVEALVGRTDETIHALQNGPKPPTAHLRTPGPNGTLYAHDRIRASPSVLDPRQGR